MANRKGIASILSKKKRQEAEVEEIKRNRSDRLIREHPLYREIKPRSKLMFFSDYFQVDDTYGTILTVMHNEGADDDLGYFWGIQLIPRNLGVGVSVRRLEHVARVPESWVAQNQGRAEGLLKNQENETERNGSFSALKRLNKRQQQLLDVANDLVAGSSYLRVAIRLMVKAPSLQELDKAVQKINRQYKDRFQTIFAQAYTGEQRREFSSIFKKVDEKLGRNFMFTSTEYAGSYSLVTRGIEDPSGEYVGQMVGDVNQSAVLLDIDRYKSHVVLAGSTPCRSLSEWDFKEQRGVDVWGAKLGVCALLNNQRAVHLVLNRAHISDLGVDLSDITANVNMTRGDINPFELFGDVEHEISIYAAHLEKFCLMVEQLQPMEPSKRAIIRGLLNETLNQFYIDKRMWVHNAQHHRDALRLVGIPHEQIPRLPEFLAYVNMRYKEQINAKNKDPDVLAAFGFLNTAIRDMLDTHGDLFNTVTSEMIDRASIASRVVYDFSSLLKRSRGVMMAQFINALGFSVGHLTKGDVVVIHGVDQLANSVKTYVREQIDQLEDNGVRVVFIYKSVESVLDDRSFNHFEVADYTLFNVGLTQSTVALYEDTMKQEVPYALKQELLNRDPLRYYIRRGFDNIVFANDVQMGFD